VREVEGHREKRLAPAVVAVIASAALSLGTSLVDTAQRLPLRVQATVNIENWTKWPLTQPIARTKTGQIDVAPRTVRPGYKEAMRVAKTPYSTYGSSGVVWWEVWPGKHAEKPFFIALMWSMPWKFGDELSDHNELAIAMTDDSSLLTFDNMSRKVKKLDANGNYWMWRKYFQKDLQAIEPCNKYVCVTASMGSDHKTEIELKITPQKTRNLAPNIKKA